MVKIYNHNNGLLATADARHGVGTVIEKGDWEVTRSKPISTMEKEEAPPGREPNIMEVASRGTKGRRQSMQDWRDR